MQKISLSITPSFAPKAQGANFCIFTDPKNYVAEYDMQSYLRSCQNYAKEHGVYLITNRMIVQDYLCLALIDNTGQLLGLQRAAHLNLSHVGIFRKANDLNVFDTEFGKLFLCVDTDIYHPEVVGAAVMRGAQVIFSSQFIELYDDSVQKILFGAFSAAQSYSINVVNVNNLNCSVCVPRELSYDQSGFVVKITDQLPVSVKIDVTRLQRVQGGIADPMISPGLLKNYSAQLAR